MIAGRYLEFGLSPSSSAVFARLRGRPCFFPVTGKTAGKPAEGKPGGALCRFYLLYRFLCLFLWVNK